MLLEALERWPEAFRDCPEPFWKTSSCVIEASTCDLSRTWLSKATWYDIGVAWEGVLGLEKYVNPSLVTTHVSCFRKLFYSRLVSRFQVQHASILSGFLATVKSHVNYMREVRSVRNYYELQ